MRVWLIKTGEPLPIDSATERLLRMGILAEELADRGCDVVWWASTFDHRRKTQRFDKTHETQLGDHSRLITLRSPGYRSNLSLRRVWDHRVAAKEFLRMAATQPRPDVILCALPTPELALAAAQYAEECDVPLVVDVRDMWPDIFRRSVPTYAKLPAGVMINYYEKMVAQACAGAAAITGHAPAFVEWGLEKAGREATPLDRHFPFGYRPQLPDPKTLSAADEFWRQQGIGFGDGTRIISFVGTLSHQFDFEPVMEAARLLGDSAPVRFVICGDGESRSELAERAAAQGNSVVFPGWIDAPQIRSLLQQSCLAIAPYHQTLDFVGSIPNKVIEYLGAGVPILTSLEEGDVPELLAKHECGESFGGCGRRLAESVRRLCESPKRLDEMSQNAAKLFDSQFRADQVYGEMIDHLVRVVDAHRGCLPRRLAA